MGHLRTPHRTPPPRALPAAVAVALSALLLAGCTGGGADAGSAGSGAAGAGSIPADASGGAADSADSTSGGLAESSANAVPAAATDRQVVTTGDVTVVVDDPRGAVDDVVALVEGRGGRVDERSEQGGPRGQGGPLPDGGAGDGAASVPADPARAGASLTVRVPAGQVTATLDALREVGEVEAVSLVSSDVTTQARDLDARISALRASTARLEALITDAATTADVIAAEQALSDRQGSLESLVAERAFLGDQVDLSTLRVQLVGTGAAPVPGPDGFFDGLDVGWNALLRALGGLLVLSGVLAPWVLVLGATGALVLALRRWRRRRSAAGGAAPA